MRSLKNIAFGGLVGLLMSCAKEVALPIDANFEVEVVDNDYSVPVYVKIHNQTEGADTFQWTFEGGEPSQSTDKNPGTVRYSTEGEYSIRLKATNRDGVEEEVNHGLIIDEAIVPGFIITIEGDDYAPVTINIENTTTGATTFDWTFEGGVPSKSKTRTPGKIVFQKPGGHLVTLVAGNGRETQIFSDTISVLQDVLADFEIEPTFEDDDFQAPATLNLVNKSVNATSFEWTFETAEPTFSTATDPMITIAEPGIHQLKLKASNSKRSHTIIKEVTIFEDTNLRVWENVELGIGSAHNANQKGALYSTMMRQVYDAASVPVDDGNEQTLPAFRRMGYGLKVGYEQERYSIGVTTFYAEDDLNSINNVPDEKEVTPKENMVLGLEGSYKILENLQLNAEYATSAMTQDLRVVEIDNAQGNLAGLVMNSRASTEYFDAIRAGLDYRFEKSTPGVGYERIAPGYETLGAYFFNNDFENITLNTGTVLFNDKLNLAFNIGYQRDNLKNQKERAMNRTVGSVNATYTASESLAITGSYSNFTTFTNSRLDQFEVINDDNLLDNAEEVLNYKQLSQNANVNINYILSKKESLQQNLNLNYALADVSNEEDGVVRLGNASTFHNGNLSYTVGFPNKGMNITTALNGTINTIGMDNSSTWGPTLNLNKKFLDNTLNTNLGASHNSSNSNRTNTHVTNFRFNATYVWKEKHNFHFNLIQLFRNLSTGSTRDLTLTFGHSYTF
ncbi:PKD domain-containing protein [Flagellimonas hadalis]|uniref:PKD domain-containing protein n=1 Tax=Flagellimonas hadalis TaxID=2597517 RepID=A0A5N5ISS0_9FLAO|nr:PKD domain-containing protein [Allomuricauda hadalis]KAB5491581.1 PKD domain-containing protein [Allomuricauda hadalis]